jgi:chemotaxis protein CheC
VKLDPFDADQEDALREIVNVAMGRAADCLARLLDVFVRLPVPRVRLLEADQIVTGILEMIGGLERVTCVRQAFGSGLHGEALAIFDPRGLDDLTRVLEPDAAAMSDENLLGISNLLVGACLGSTGRALGHELVFAPPSVLTRDGTLATVLGTAARSWRYALLIEVSFTLEGQQFACHVLAFFPEESLTSVRRGVDTFLESLA